MRCSTPRRCATLHARERLVDADDADVSEGVAVGVDLSGHLGGSERPGVVGYRAKRHTGLIDVERRGGYTCSISGSRCRRVPTRA